MQIDKRTMSFRHGKTTFETMQPILDDIIEKLLEFKHYTSIHKVKQVLKKHSYYVLKPLNFLENFRV